jgi:hypothetical protein
MAMGVLGGLQSIDGLLERCGALSGRCEGNRSVTDVAARMDTVQPHTREDWIDLMFPEDVFCYGDLDEEG